MNPRPYRLSFAAVLYAHIANQTFLITKKSVQQELRPYVYLAIKPRAYPSRHPNRWSVSLVVSSIGKTPPRNLVLIYRRVSQQESRGRDPFDLLKWEGKSPMALTPGQEMLLQFGDVSFSTAKEIGEQFGDDYVAWVKYKDSITDPPVVWQTQLSQHLRGDAEGAIAFAIRGTHNCVDQDCPQ